MAGLLTVTLIFLQTAPGSFEGMSRQVAALLDGWVAYAPSSPHSSSAGAMFKMACSLVRADSALRNTLAEGGEPTREFSDCMKAAAASIDWYRGSLALFNGASTDQWRARGEGLVRRLHLLQDNELEYLESLELQG
ncbi:MAG: hypothetical protein R6V62_10265 [Candidatus Fermentibacteraceae bacterium]